jgi:hypothetical protein
LFAQQGTSRISDTVRLWRFRLSDKIAPQKKVFAIFFFMLLTSQVSFSCNFAPDFIRFQVAFLSINCILKPSISFAGKLKE